MEAYRLMVIITIIGKNIRFRWNIWNILILQFHPFLVHRDFMNLASKQMRREIPSLILPDGEKVAFL